MSYLPLANILHHKLRSALSALGIGISVCMLITLAGLSRGSLNEVVDRWNGVDAELVVCPADTSLTMASGAAIRLATADRIAGLGREGRALTRRVTPAYLARMTIGGREHNVFGIRAEDFAVFSGGAKLIAGRLPDSDGRFAAWLARQFDESAASGVELDITQDQLAEHGGLEMAIDTKLAAMLDKGLGERFYAAGHTWRIVGIFQAGAVSRAVAPLASLQYAFNGRADRVTLLFVQLRRGTSIGSAAEAIRSVTRLNVVPISEYKAMLLQNVGIMFAYVDTVNTVAMVIAFLFIMVTLYMIVLQRTREIAILKSMGAGAGFLMRQVLAESMLVTTAGTIAGIAMSYASAYAIEQLRPDLTVTITAGWIGVAIAAAVAGGLLAGLYPAWRAIGVDVAESLTFE